MADKTPNLDSLFIAALEIDTPEKRIAFLRQSFGDNEELLCELTEMQSAQDQIGSFLEVVREVTSVASNEIDAQLRSFDVEAASVTQSTRPQTTNLHGFFIPFRSLI